MTVSLVQPDPELELSIVIPCLNERATIGSCIDKAFAYLHGAAVEGEVVVADNGSTDGSVAIVEASGARLVRVSHRGYGSALRAGVDAARGRYVIMGDADDSYDFSALQPFLDELRNGSELVVGNRFQGGIEPGAMPFLNRYVGNPVLSFVGRRLFKITIGDFHCGLRGCDRAAISALDLTTSGMEYASEMIVRSQLAGLRIAEVPTTLSRDGRPGGSHLRALSDGLRHLLFLFLYCPRWLFFVPGALLMTIGLTAGIPTALGPVALFGVRFDVDTLAVAAAALIIGVQAVQFGLLANLYGARMHLFSLPSTPRRLFGAFSFVRVAAATALLIGAGVAGVVIATLEWQHAGFGALNTRHEVRLIIPAITALVVGFQLLLGRLFMGLLGSEFAEGQVS
ncbi:MAG TPA: glycosyltransferase family 2 protein [Acidimicrobiales bacterium]|nr:glycosyltransferase family 2 protein [Acidimicrobiales bacterium]